jgi:predicted ATPase/class 3 adenylate cyclase
MPALPSGTVVFLFTDIEGSTARWEADRAAMALAVERHLALLRQAVDAHGGVPFKVVGDALQAAFPTAPAAVAAALEAQRALLAEAWAAVEPPRVRMALHAGEAAPDARGDYLAPALNRLARLLATGHGGQVLLSQAVQQLARDALPADASLRDLGEHRLRDLLEPERVFQLCHPDLPADFPPLRSLDARPNNLPRQPTPFLGREREVREIVSLLENGNVRLLTLIGPPGVGKTRLALQAAAEALDAFPDGVAFVPLAPLADPALVPAAIAAAVGVREAGGVPLTEVMAAYLRDKRLLLVLDNFEHLLSAAPLVAELLAASPRLVVLATSRAPLRLRAEREWEVPTLAIPDTSHLPSGEALLEYAAVRLFVERAVAARADFALTADNAEAVAGICVRLEGLPLAIELAAARIRLFSPAALLARLEKRLPLLTGGARDAPDRQRTLRDAIAWSHDLLDQEEQTLFRRLAVFAGGASFAAVETVANPGGELDVFAGLASLVEASLLREEVGGQGEPRVSMFEVIREFGSEQLAASGEEEAVRRDHAAWCLAFAEQTGPSADGPDAAASLEALEREHANLRAALAWLAERGDGGRLVRLAGALWPFWREHTYYREGRRWLELALALGAEAPAADRLQALKGAGAMAWYQTDVAATRTWLSEALALARELGDRRSEGLLLSSLSTQATEAGDLDGALAYDEEALAIARSADDPEPAIHALHNLAHTEWVRGDGASAMRRLEEALALARGHGVGWIVPSILNGMGTIIAERGDHARAAEAFREGLALGRSRGNSGDVVDAMEGLARLGAAGEAKAARLFGAAARLRDEIGAPLTPTERAYLDPVMSALEEALGAEEFAAAWAAGRALSPEQAIAEALELAGEP